MVKSHRLLTKINNDSSTRKRLVNWSFFCCGNKKKRNMQDIPHVLNTNEMQHTAWMPLFIVCRTSIIQAVRTEV